MTRIITEPGLYPDIPIDDYHRNPFLCNGPSISSTGLKQVIDRPSLYWAYSPYNPKRFERTAQTHFNFGKAAHLLLLEEGVGFHQQFAVRPETYPNDPAKKWNANSNDCKAWLAEQEANRRAVITQADMDAISYIRDSLAAHPVVQGGILDGLTEMTMLAKFGRVWLRARPDKVPPHSGDFADLKTAASVSYDDIERNVFKLGYHIQAAIVRKVAREVMGKDWQWGGFAFVFVEKTPPYDVRILQLRDEDIDLGERQVNRALLTFEQCIERMEWPGEEGFERSIDFIGLPAWARTRIETEIQTKEAA